jgi:glycine/D-amino acid oxidase-like deaminating enzyme
MTVAEKNFWLTTVDPPVISAQPLPETVDVAVVGAGFTGLSAARTLGKGGARVAVLEAENVGWGASCRNGGMVLTGLKLGIPALMRRYGREATRRMYAASLESIDCVEEVVREEAIQCDFTRCGHLEVACKARHFEEFRRARSGQRSTTAGWWMRRARG